MTWIGADQVKRTCLICGRLIRFFGGCKWEIAQSANFTYNGDDFFVSVSDGAYMDLQADAGFIVDDVAGVSIGGLGDGSFGANSGAQSLYLGTTLI